MIKVQRTPEPDVLRRNGTSWLDNLLVEDNELERIKADPNSTDVQISLAKNRVKKAQEKYKHRAIKEALKKMFHGKCAYCESPVTVVTYAEIEHFYPKGDPGYRLKTFLWQNLLLSCNICNNTEHKGTQFPLDGNDNPVLIDPTDGITEPDTHLLFSWDEDACLASVYGRDGRGKQVERIFDLNGLNGRKELIKERSRYVEKLIVILKLFAQHGGNPEAKKILQDACKPDAPYSAFALKYIAPHL